MELLSLLGAVITAYCCCYAIRDDLRCWKSRMSESVSKRLKKGERRRENPQPEVKLVFWLSFGKGFQGAPLNMRQRLLHFGKKALRFIMRQVGRATDQTKACCRSAARTANRTNSRTSKIAGELNAVG